MIALFCLLLLFISMPMTVKSETCGGSSGPPCNISVVFAAFQNAHLVAITPNWEFDLCIILVPHENFNGTTITAYYRNGTLGSQNKETYTFTDEPDVVNMTLSNDLSILYQFRMLYADLEACFIVNFIPESIVEIVEGMLAGALYRAVTFFFLASGDGSYKLRYLPECFNSCRLWIFNGATSEQIKACSEAHAQACPGTLHDTWDEESCDRLLESA